MFSIGNFVVAYVFEGVYYKPEDANFVIITALSYVRNFVRCRREAVAAELEYWGARSDGNWCGEGIFRPCSVSCLLFMSVRCRATERFIWINCAYWGAALQHTPSRKLVSACQGSDRSFRSPELNLPLPGSSRGHGAGFEAQW